jgi:hypothetical protein
MCAHVRYSGHVSVIRVDGIHAAEETHSADACPLVSR